MPALPDQPSRLRRWLPRLLMVFGSVLIGLLIAEVVARFVVPDGTATRMYAPSTDPELGYVLRAGADFSFDGVAVKIPPTRVVISEQGLRNRTVAVPKPPGVQRLVCLGDSFTFGWGVEADEAFCQRLEALLGAPWETINLGVPGYNTAQQVRLLETVGLAFEPDLVIVTYNKTDLEPPVDHGDADSWIAWMVDHSALVRWLHIAGLVGGDGQRDDDGSNGAGPEGEGEPGDDSPDGGAGPRFGEDAVRQALEKLGQLGRDHDMGVMVFLYPSDANSRFEITACQDAGLHQASLIDATAGEGLVIPVDLHPNAEGHRRLADTMARILRERGLLVPRGAPRPPAPRH